MVEYAPGALFEDHAPQRYVEGLGIGESWSWNDLLIVTVCWDWPPLMVGPHAASRRSNPSPQKALKISIRRVGILFCLLLKIIDSQIHGISLEPLVACGGEESRRETWYYKATINLELWVHYNIGGEGWEKLRFRLEVGFRVIVGLLIWCNYVKLWLVGKLPDEKFLSRL